MTRIGIITCENRSIICAGLNCFRALSSRLETFARYGDGMEVVGFTTCGGCPGHLAPKKVESMIKYGGAEKIHLSSCIFRSLPNPNKSLEEIEAECTPKPSSVKRLNQDDFVVQLAKLVKSGQLPHVCPFKEKMKKDIAILGVEVIVRTHDPHMFTG